MVSLQAVLNIFRGSSPLGIPAFDAPKLHLLMHFTWQAVCNTASDLERDNWWMEMDFFFPYGSSPPLKKFFYEFRRVDSKGPNFPDQGASFSSHLCVFVAEPLLLKYHHSNLLLWFPIERISSPSFPEWNLWLFAARVWCFPFPASSLVPADC